MNESIIDNNNRNISQLIFEEIFLIFVCIFANVSNACMWIIICRTKKHRNIANMFVLSVTTTGWLVSILNMPTSLMATILGQWPLSSQACQVFGFFNMFTLVHSVLSLCNISINRYVSVCKPFSISVIYTAEKSALMIAACIIVSIFISTPPLYGWAEYGYIEEQYFCFCVWSKSPSYAFFMIGVCFGIPLTVMIICNVMIYITYRASKIRITRVVNKTVEPTLTTTITLSDLEAQSKNDEKNEIEKNEHLNSKLDDIRDEMSDFNTGSIHNKKRLAKKTQVKVEDIRLALALAICVICFFISWFPFCISMLLNIYSPDTVSNKFHLWTLLIGYSNSCMNPVIYGIVNKKIGEGFKDIFCVCCKQCK